MNNAYSLIDCFYSSQGLNKKVIIIITMFSINAIFISYSLFQYKSRTKQLKQDLEKQKSRAKKIARLYP